MFDRKAYLKKWEVKNRDKRNEYSKRWQTKHKEQNLANKKRYKKEHPEKTKLYEDRKYNKRFYGGLRYKVLERDNYACLKCGMTDDEHRRKWGKSIQVDHIDGQGHMVDKPNNKMSNLQTLCISCHMKKDQRDKRNAIFQPKDIWLMRKMRGDGKTLLQIANHFNNTTSYMWMILNGKRWADV